MAITEVTTVTVDGITIGLSESIGTLISNGDFTVENLTPYMFCGQLNYVTPKFTSLTGAEKNYTGSAGSAPLYFPNVNPGSLGGVTVEFAINDDPTFTNDLYGRNVLLYDTGRVESIHSDSTGMTARVVTSIDFKKIYYDVDAANKPITTGRPAETIGCYVSGATGTVKTIDNDVDTLIKVYSIVESDSTWYCILDNMFPASDTDGYSHICSSWQYMQGNFDNTYESLNYCLDSFDKTKSMFKYAVSSNYEIYGGEGGNWNNSFTSYVDITEDVYSYMDYYALNYSANFHCYIKTLNGALEQLARAGLKFKWNNTWYKPVGEGGYITGYTDDMTETSDWDDIEDVTGNTVPVTPPGPTPPGPSGQDSDWDNIAINGAGIGGGSAFCRFYYCTEAELANLRTWTMGLSSGGDTIPGGFDPKSNIIGLTVFPFTVSGNGPTTIKFTTNGGQDPITQQPMPRVVDSGVSCEGGAGATTRILNATIDVPATMKDRGEPWLDYESYIELFIPMCGIYQVDPQVVIGRTIHIEIFLDPISGTVMGIAWVSKENGKCVVAQGSGTPGVQIPVAVGNYGLAQAARVQNTLSGFGNTASSALTNQVISNAYGVPGQVSPTVSNGRIVMGLDTSAKGRIGSFNNAGRSAALGFSGLISSVNHWVSARQIANSPGTSASGGFSGSMAEWCGVFTPYVKIVRPKFRKPSNYKHTCGEPEVSARKLNSVGYAICINPDVSGLTNATETERMAIYQFLSTGVYYK